MKFLFINSKLLKLFSKKDTVVVSEKARNLEITNQEVLTGIIGKGYYLIKKTMNNFKSGQETAGIQKILGEVVQY